MTILQKFQQYRHVIFFVHSPLDINYEFCLWYKWMQALIYPYFTVFYPVCVKADWYYWFTKNTVNHLLKSFHFRHVMVWEYLEMNTLKFRVSHYLIILFFWLCNRKFRIYFWHRLDVFCLKRWKFLRAQTKFK